MRADRVVPRTCMARACEECHHSGWSIPYHSFVLRQVLDTSSVQMLVYPLRFTAPLAPNEPAAISTTTARNDIYLFDDYGVVHGNAISWGAEHGGGSVN